MSTLALPFLSTAVHLEGDKEIVIYQDDLEGEHLFTLFQLLTP